jgi:methyl-accepting chemotaxis protein
MWPARSRVFSRVPLRRKLVFCFLVAAILPLLIAGYLSYQAIARQAEQSAVREMVSVAESASKTATEFMDSRCGDILIWSKLRAIGEVLELREIRDEVCESLREMAEVSGVYEAIVLVDTANGKCAAASRPDWFDIDFSQNDVFSQAKTGKVAISALERNKMVEHSDKDSGGWTLAIAVPVKVQEKVRGVLIAYLRWKSLETPLIGTKVAQSGYVSIVDKDGRTILHPNRTYYGLQLTGKELNQPQLWDAMRNQRQSVVYENGSPTSGKHELRTAGIAYPRPVRNLKDLEWKVVADAPSTEVLLLPNILGTLGMIAVGVVVVVLALSLVLADKISKPITAIADVARQVAGRDLTVEVPNLPRTDEIGDLSAAFGSMLESIKLQINQMLQTTDVLKEAAQQIRTTVSEVASGAAQVAGSVSQTAATVEEVRQSAKVSGDKAKKLAEIARTALGASIEGREATDGTIQGMQTIRHQVELVGETVTKLGEQSMSIEQIVATVQDLADQSKLLAVNASIEAARAGDMGKGFSVVAHEIKSLADQSRQATRQIGDILKNTQKWIGAVVTSMKQVDAAVEAGIGQSSKSGEAIAILNQSVEMSSKEATFIETSSSQQSGSMDQVSIAMVSIEEAMNQNLNGVRQLEDAAGKLLDLGQQVRKLLEAYRT